MNRGKYEALIDPASWAYIDRINGWYPPEILDLPIDRQRTVYDAMCRAFHPGYPAGVEATDSEIAARGHAIPIRRYRLQGEEARGDGRLLSWRRLRPRRARQP